MTRTSNGAGFFMRGLLPYVDTDTQREQLEAVIAHGSNRKAAKALGLNPSAVDRTILRIKRNAASRGYSPEADLTRPAPDGLGFKGASLYYPPSEDGPGGWFKYEQDKAAQEDRWREAIKALSESIPREKPAKGPVKAQLAELLNCYVITDYHLGMKAWHQETGADWDTHIAEELLVKWFSSAIAHSPEAENGLLLLLGDFLHWDGLEAVTPTSKHVLDADTRFQKVVRVAIRVIRRVVHMLLRKHKTLRMIIAEGNHDIASSVWLRELLSALYDDEPRVSVDQNPDPYYCFEFGKVSIFAHHGHKKKFSAVADVFAAKFREVWGRTKFSYVHMGHYHFDHAQDGNLMKVEQHRTLAAPDSHASRGGWISPRDAKVITYHKQYGEVGRITRSPEMVEAA